MPSNKIGKLKAGQGLRRILAQRQGGWKDEDAKASYEIGSELEPHRSSTGQPGREGRWNGSGR